MYLERAEQRVVQGGLSENGKDVFEKDAGAGEVGELAESFAELYLEMGEFGGAGGGGGGEASLRGIGTGSLFVGGGRKRVSAGGLNQRDEAVCFVGRQS